MQDCHAKHLSAVVSGWQNTAHQQAVRNCGIRRVTANAKQWLIRGAFLEWYHQTSEAAMTRRAMIHKIHLKRCAPQCLTLALQASAKSAVLHHVWAAQCLIMLFFHIGFVRYSFVFLSFATMLLPAPVSHPNTSGVTCNVVAD